MRWSAVVLVLAALAVWRVAGTHHLFSPTWDEPAHIYAGYEYLVDHRYAFDKSHPPLARAAFAWPLRDARSAQTDIHERLGEVLTSKGHYMAGVVAARRVNLLFLAIAVLGVAYAAGNLRIGIIAAALFTLLPALLAHAGVATTDLPVTAAFAVALGVVSRWVRTPDWRYTLALALAAGAGLAIKFSFPVFFGIAALVVIVAERRFPWRQALLAAFGALAVVWAVYFFRQLPRFFTGFAAVMAKNAAGHDAYFRGEVRATGWWDYFPTVFAVKTPIAFLLLVAIGVVFLFRERRGRHLPVIAALMLLSVMFSGINLGVRHILPMYVPLAIVAAAAIDRLWASRARWLAPALVVWLAANSVLAHPDYLPWMNAFAGKHPERLVLDSNFDWGQDVLRLRDACRESRIPAIGVALNGTVDLKRIGMPPARPIDPATGAPGWYAVSEGFIIPAQVRDPRAYAWLTRNRPFRRIGKTIRLYEVH